MPFGQFIQIADFSVSFLVFKQEFYIKCRQQL